MELLKKGALLGMAAAAAAACDLTREAPLVVEEDRISVFSVLEAGADTLSVLVVRAPVDAVPGGTGFFSVSGAEVRIVTPTGRRVDLVEGPRLADCFVPHDGIEHRGRGSGCYRGVAPGRVRSGGSYALRVVLPAGGAVRGEARVPETPEITTPPTDARVTIDTAVAADTAGRFDVRLGAPPASPRLELFARSLREDCLLRLRIPREFAPRGRLAFVAPNTLVFRGGGRTTLGVTVDRTVCTTESNDAAAFDSLPVGVALTAYDSGYTRYVERVLNSSDPIPNGHGSVGLTGAFGLFAGAASVHRRVVLVPEE